MLAVGAIGSSFYSVQRDISMSPGDTASLGKYSFQYLGVENQVFPDRDQAVAQFDVYSGDSRLGIMEARRTFYHQFNIGATRAAIRSTPVEDFYIVPSEFGVDGSAVFRVYINPLVWWMWAAGPLIVLGAVLAMSPQRQPAPTLLRAPGGAQTARA